MSALGLCCLSLSLRSTQEPQGNSCTAVVVSSQQAGQADQGTEQVLPESCHCWSSHGDK